MKRIYILLFLLLVQSTFIGQQDAMYTQYMFNTLSINPGYAGSADMLSINLVSRHQWLAIEGAPETQTFALHGPIKSQKIGVGLCVVNDRVGPTRDLSLYGDFSYRLRLSEESSLFLGLKGGVNNLKVSLDELSGTDENDMVFQQNISQLKPNFGFGLYYSSPKSYIGVSAPKLMENKFSSGGTSLLLNRHYFLIAGLVTRLSNHVDFKPSFIAKYVFNAPVSMDFSANFIIKDKFWLGTMYRLNDAIGGLIQLQLSNQFRLGYAYDYTISEFGVYAGGTHEVLLNYDFNFPKDDLVSPRYF
ncbi:MAG: type IX secretion system membrane protein PorP/SprF [Flavobacteriales bacterium]|nr:type IX secretion system membrane protein PorP/SprF [Flavobacteriales bacterium]